MEIVGLNTDLKPRDIQIVICTKKQVNIIFKWRRVSTTVYSEIHNCTSELFCL